VALDFIIQDDPLPWEYDLAEGNLLPSGKRLLWTKDIAFTQKQVDGQERIYRENSLGGEGFFYWFADVLFFLFWYLFWSDICAMEGTMVDSKKHQFPLEDEERTGKNFTSYKASFWVSSVQMHVHIGANLMCDSSTYIYSTNIHPP